MDPLHYPTVVNAFLEGRVVPFLGAGANRCGRPAAFRWKPQQTEHLPDGNELAAHLAERHHYPKTQPDLVGVSQYVLVMRGSGPLYDELRGVFNANYPPTPLHYFLASLPAKLTGIGCPRPHLLVVSTNYDDLMEQAFTKAGERFDVVTYVAGGARCGKYLHRSHEGELTLIETPNQYHNLSLEDRSVILKVHGAVDRSNAHGDSYVITEDDYIEFLSRTDMSCAVPALLKEKMCRSHLLFLGYGLRDWNLRAVLRRIWGEQERNWSWWGIQLNPDPIEQRFWRWRDLEILDVSLEEYVLTVQEQLDKELQEAGAPCADETPE
jgi:hypothetical protein